MNNLTREIMTSGLIRPSWTMNKWRGSSWVTHEIRRMESEEQLRFSVWEDNATSRVSVGGPGVTTSWQEECKRCTNMDRSRERDNIVLLRPLILLSDKRSYNWSLNFNKTPQKKMKGQESSQTKFIWSVAILQLVMVGIYWLLFRYDENAHPFKYHHKEEEWIHFSCNFQIS